MIRCYFLRIEGTFSTESYTKKKAEKVQRRLSKLGYRCEIMVLDLPLDHALLSVAD